MTNADLLRRLDLERRAAGEPSVGGEVVREVSRDGSECTIMHSTCNTGNIAEVIRQEIARASTGKYRLEWKVYGHDQPPDLKDRLVGAGFVPELAEVVMILPVTDEALRAFAAPTYDIRRVHDGQGLDDVAEISREIGRTNAESERARLAGTLESTPSEVSVYVAYLDGAPVACGRIHFNEGSEFADLCGGRTRTTHRNRGLYTALVAARMKEALRRKRKYLAVDALPTSEPVLRKRGFQRLTDTQPFVYEP
jgi:hypothetical protein